MISTKSAKRKKTQSLNNFVTSTKKNRGGQRSPLDDHPQASADLEAFARLKAKGTATASWNQFATWFKDTHGIDMRANSLYTWSRNRGFLNG